MTSWSNLLDDYNFFYQIADGSSTTITDIIDSPFMVNIYLDAVDNLYNIFLFVYQALVSSAFLVVVFFGLWAFLLVPILRKLGIW